MNNDIAGDEGMIILDRDIERALRLVLHLEKDARQGVTPDASAPIATGQNVDVGLRNANSAARSL